MKHAPVRTRVKICGLTRESDVRAACDLGVDALGFVFYPKSKRCLTPVQAGRLSQVRSVFVSSVALFVEPDDDLVQAVIHHMRPDYLQFHGDETPDACERFNYPYIKAFRVGAPGLDTPENLLSSCSRYESAKAWLFDSYTPAYGGSGHAFDRSLLSLVVENRTVPIILSGGLKVESLEATLELIKPDAVDVSSGVELEPGVKSMDKMRAFIQAVRAQDFL